MGFFSFFFGGDKDEDVWDVFDNEDGEQNIFLNDEYQGTSNDSKGFLSIVFGNRAKDDEE